MKILYLGLEWDGLCHGGEYEVINVLKYGLGFVVEDDNGCEQFIGKHACEIVRERTDDMKKYYYTFGSDKNFPYQNGWVEIHAASWEQAHEKFRSRFPDRHENTLNCSFFYDEVQWVKMDPEHNWTGWRCHAVY